MKEFEWIFGVHQGGGDVCEGFEVLGVQKLGKAGENGGEVAYEERVVGEGGVVCGDIDSVESDCELGDGVA